MQDIRIFRSVLSVGRARTFPHSSKSDGDEYDSDELNDTGVFNNSSLTIVKNLAARRASGMVPWPSVLRCNQGFIGWGVPPTVSLHHSFPSATLIQRHRSDVQRSIDPFPSALSTTCKTWQQAVRVWDLACQSKTVTLLRSEPRSASAINRPATEIPPPHPSDGTSTSHTLVSGDGNPLVLAPTSGTSISSIPVPKKLPGVIVISDTESECGSDSDIEATYPEKIRKGVRLL